MTRTSITLLATTLACVTILVGCGDPTLPPATRGGGFILQTLYVAPGTSIAAWSPYVQIGATWSSDLPGATGDPAGFLETTDLTGLGSAAGKRAPAEWTFSWKAGGQDPNCSKTKSFKAEVTINNITDIVCHYVPIPDLEDGPVLGFSPGTLYEARLPLSVTGTAPGISSQYGMPLLQYFDLNGTLIAQTSASSVSGGNTLTANTPNLSAVPSGIYGGLIQNAQAGGSYSVVGGGAEFVVAPPGYVTYTVTSHSCSFTSWNVYNNWEYHDASGVVHLYPNLQVSNFNGAPCGSQPPYSAWGTSSDGVQLTVTASPQATLAGGTAVPVRPN